MKLFKCSNGTLINIDRVNYCYIEKSKMELTGQSWDCVFNLEGKPSLNISSHFTYEEDAQKEVDDFENFCKYGEV